MEGKFIMNKQILMNHLWLEYKKTNDINFLIQACNEAPFFGNPGRGKEIGRLLSKITN